MHAIGRQLPELVSALERVVAQAEAEQTRITILSRGHKPSSTYSIEDEYTQRQHIDELVREARAALGAAEVVAEDWPEYISMWMGFDISEMEVGRGETD